jgi:hypothetical protein
VLGIAEVQEGEVGEKEVHRCVKLKVQLGENKDGSVAKESQGGDN